MAWLVLGLILFLGVHCVRMVADGWRTQMVAQWGARRWKLSYAVVSAIGLALIVWGYSLARQTSPVLWQPPIALRHLSALLVLVAFILVTAADIPGNHLKARLHHPMLLGVKTWALAHLLSRGTVAAALLFGSFLIWAALCFRSARQRDAAAGTIYAPGRASRTAITVVVGAALWALFAFWIHGAWLGFRPLG